MSSDSQIIRKAAGIKLALFDVDGVLTDGKLYLGENGQEIRTSHVRDGHGLKLLNDAGIATGLISGRPAGAMRDRATALNMAHLFFEVSDKVAVFESLMKKLGLSADQISFMGDDTPDLPLLGECGLALAVADAHPEVIRQADWVSQYSGGNGAAREACDLILAAQ